MEGVPLRSRGTGGGHSGGPRAGFGRLGWSWAWWLVRRGALEACSVPPTTRQAGDPWLQPLTQNSAGGWWAVSHHRPTPGLSCLARGQFAEEEGGWQRRGGASDRPGQGGRATIGECADLGDLGQLSGPPPPPRGIAQQAPMRPGRSVLGRGVFPSAGPQVRFGRGKRFGSDRRTVQGCRESDSVLREPRGRGRGGEAAAPLCFVLGLVSGQHPEVRRGYSRLCLCSGAASSGAQRTKRSAGC